MSNAVERIDRENPAPRFNDRAFGSWGEFSSVGDQVFYLSTQVRLAPNLDNVAKSLVESIAPVREVLDTTKMEFGALLQRDLEDYRVLHKLIPYLMNRRDYGVSFFPPLLGVLLPFVDGQQSSFPEVSTAISADDKGLKTSDIQSGDYFRLRRDANVNGELYVQRRMAELEWDRDKCRLVIIDGQHRAMALLKVILLLRQEI